MKTVLSLASAALLLASPAFGKDEAEARKIIIDLWSATADSIWCKDTLTLDDTGKRTWAVIVFHDMDDDQVDINLLQNSLKEPVLDIVVDSQRHLGMPAWCALMSSSYGPAGTVRPGFLVGKAQ